MDYIRPIGPVERDIDPVYKVERATDDREEKRQPPEERPPKKEPQAQPQTPEDVGPVEGDDGHLHIDIRA